MGVYWVIFWVGVIYTVVTFILGGITGFIDIDTDFDIHLDTHLHGYDVSPTLGISPLKPITIVAFITVFGGVGIMGTKHGLNPIITFCIALIVALFIAFLIYKFLLIPLYKAQNTSSIYQKQLIGVKGKVVTPIIKDGFGTISYIVNGSTYNAPAQHVTKEAIPQGAEILIFKIEGNVFYVEPLNDTN